MTDLLPEYSYVTHYGTPEGTATMTRTVEVLDPFVDGHACHICGRSGCVVVGDKGNFRLLCSNGE